MRSLGPDEQELWARVAATIRPLSREKADAPVPPAPARPSPRPPQPTEPRAAIAQRAPAPPTRTLDSGWDRRLRSGDVEPDVVLDLHGLNLDQAWSAIDRGLDQAIGAGKRVMLLVTGHSRPGDPPVRRGRIRAAVHDWLEVSRHAAKIAAVRGAHRRHGGGGSLYIILRRNRPKSTVS